MLFPLVSMNMKKLKYKKRWKLILFKVFKVDWPSQRPLSTNEKIIDED